MDILKQHFMNPLNFGTIKKTNFVGKSKSGFCGDSIEAYIKINGDIIEDAKYQACGCWALIASASLFSEYIKGKTSTEVLNLSDEEYLKLLGDIPEEKVNCAFVSKAAFINAMKNGV